MADLYDDVGNPLAFQFGDLDDDCPGEVIAWEPSTSQAADIPLSVADVVCPEKPPINHQSKTSLSMLKEVCLKFGLTCTIPMENQIKSMSVVESITIDHIIWYVRGIVMANQSMILPAVNDAANELRSETKHLQNVMNNAQRTAADLGKMAQVFSSVMANSTASVKSAFEATLKNIAEDYGRVSTASTKGKEVEQKEPVAGVSTPIIATSEQTAILQKEPKIDVIEPTVVTEEFKRLASTTVASKHTILAEKRKLLINIGYAAKLMKEFTDDYVEAMVPDAVLQEAAKVRMTSKVKSAIKSITSANLDRHLRHLLR